MKRDLEIVRGLLLWAEADLDPQQKPEALASATEEQLAFHTYLLIDGNLVHGIAHPSNRRGRQVFDKWTIHHLTWDGCEFLDSARDPRVWKKVTQTTGAILESISVKAIAELLVKITLDMVKPRLLP